jgi:hypothetical protein
MITSVVQETCMWDMCGALSLEGRTRLHNSDGQLETVSNENILLKWYYPTKHL